MNHHCNGVAPCRWERESERIRALVVRAFGELQAAVGNPKRAVSYAKRAMAILEKVGPPAPAPSPSTEDGCAFDGEFCATDCAKVHLSCRFHPETGKRRAPVDAKTGRGG